MSLAFELLLNISIVTLSVSEIKTHVLRLDKNHSLASLQIPHSLLVLLKTNAIPQTHPQWLGGQPR